MQLDRNIEGNHGRGKYALLLLRKLAEYDDAKTFGGLHPRIADALKTLEDAGVIDWGTVGTESEFMLIRLKDKYAQAALQAYAWTAKLDDPQYAAEIEAVALRAGPNSLWCKNPD